MSVMTSASRAVRLADTVLGESEPSERTLPPSSTTLLPFRNPTQHISQDVSGHALGNVPVDPCRQSVLDRLRGLGERVRDHLLDAWISSQRAQVDHRTAVRCEGVVQGNLYRPHHGLIRLEIDDANPVRVVLENPSQADHHDLEVVDQGDGNRCSADSFAT